MPLKYTLASTNIVVLAELCNYAAFRVLQASQLGMVLGTYDLQVCGPPQAQQLHLPSCNDAGEHDTGWVDLDAKTPVGLLNKARLSLFITATKPCTGHMCIGYTMYCNTSRAHLEVVDWSPWLCAGMYTSHASWRGVVMKCKERNEGCMTGDNGS